jgi:DNA modification methylase
VSAGDRVNLVKKETPKDYHCQCDYCLQVIGNLRPLEGKPYSRLERREYYDKSEVGKSGHIAKTPLHVARWAIQAYTKVGDWVFDPTVGAGTTAVEALTQGRHAAGVELQFEEILKANVRRARRIAPRPTPHVKLKIGDARKIGEFLKTLKSPVQLVVNNPPYSGDEHAGVGAKTDPLKTWTTSYESGLPNLAFLREGEEYWKALQGIYAACAEHLVPGGHFVVAVKDMMRSRKPFLLHKDLCDLLTKVGLTFVGTAFLRHYPTTLFLNTYEKRYGVTPPLYQTISIFKKRGKK